jgi:peptide/nickel transport system substrate-binding protein
MYSFIYQKYRSLLTFSLLFLCTLIVLTGCSSKSDNGSGEKIEQSKKVTLIHNFKTGSLDPNNSVIPLKAGVTETLVRLDENLEIKPWLSSKWEQKDNLTWVFTIKDGVKFQDGVLLDAKAVKSSFQRAIAANESLSGALKIASMDSQGQELTIVTSEAHPSLPSELINPNTSVISVEAEKKMGTEAFNMAPIGTGPFKVKKFTPNIEVLLERYDEYWDGLAKLNEVAFKFNEDGNVRVLALQSKEAEIVYQIPAESVKSIESDKDLKVESIPSLRVHFLLYNQKKTVLQDVKVRKAIDLLLDRESIATDIMLGHAMPANGPFNSSLPFGSDSKIEKINVEESKKLLQQAGFKAGSDGKMMKDGKPLTLELLTYKGRPELPLIAQLLQSDAAKAGITVLIKTVENVDSYLRENTDWDFVTYSNISAPRGDGGYFLNSALMKGGSLNAADIGSDRISDVVNTLNGTEDIVKRVKLTQDASIIIKEETPHSYAVYPNIIVGVNKKIVDFKPTAEDYYVITNKVDVK